MGTEIPRGEVLMGMEIPSGEVLVGTEIPSGGRYWWGRRSRRWGWRSYTRCYTAIIRMTAVYIRTGSGVSL